LADAISADAPDRHAHALPPIGWNNSIPNALGKEWINYLRVATKMFGFELKK